MTHLELEYSELETHRALIVEILVDLCRKFSEGRVGQIVHLSESDV